MVHIRNRRSQEAVRWYVLTLPTAIGGRDNIYSSKGLDAELSRRKRCGEPLFEYFAPSYVEARKVGGKMVNTRKPLLYNYVFIHASENEIFRLKRIMPLYNLLPRVSCGLPRTGTKTRPHENRNRGCARRRPTRDGPPQGVRRSERRVRRPRRA